MRRGGVLWLLLGWVWSVGCAAGGVVGGPVTSDAAVLEEPAEPELPEALSVAHDELLQHYESVDARYADLEEVGDLPDRVARNLTDLRVGYLQMQDHHLEWVETEWFLKSRQGEAGERRYYWHKAYRALQRIGEHQEELIAIHGRLARVAGWLGGRDLQQRHQVLARDHQAYREYVSELSEHFWEVLRLDSDHEAMVDPMEDTPFEEAPDGVISL